MRFIQYRVSWNFKIKSPLVPSSLVATNPKLDYNCEAKASYKLKQSRLGIICNYIASPIMTCTTSWGCLILPKRLCSIWKFLSPWRFLLTRTISSSRPCHCWWPHNSSLHNRWPPHDLHRYHHQCLASAPREPPHCWPAFARSEQSSGSRSELLTLVTLPERNSWFYRTLLYKVYEN